MAKNHVEKNPSSETPMEYKIITVWERILTVATG